MNRKNALPALAAIAALALPAAASAANAGMEHHQAMVALDDLDLTSEPGMAEMKQRVKRAAHRVCRINGDRSVRARMAERACFADAMQRGETQMAAAIGNASKGG